MNKSITKNISYDKFNDICVNSAGKDIERGQKLIKGDVSLNDCLAGCARKTNCSGIEHYEKGWGDNFHCYHFYGDGADRPAKGRTGAKRFNDATCYVKG